MSDSVKLKVLYYSFQVFFALIPSVLWALDKEKAVDPQKKKKKNNSDNLKAILIVVQ